MTSSAHRGDIDGIRAIAVLSVVAYHLGAGLLPGGFVGVDVFFVISGYLIGKILISDIDAGRFSILSFYERRIRRIFPALFVMMFVSVVLGYFLLPPINFKDLTESAGAAAASVSNFFFWRRSGYFTMWSSLFPLLHTWSLGVEEQFYIFFPVILILAKRYQLRWNAVLLPLFVISLASSIYLVRVSPNAAFYSPLARTWELTCGALLAVNSLNGSRPRWWREIGSLAGLCAIGYSILFYTRSTPFPGEMAILPCIGAALIIFFNGGEKTFVGSALALQPLKFMGLISYSVYLWHWPLLVYSKFIFLRRVEGPLLAALLLALFLLSVASWRFIETPFRQKTNKDIDRPVFYWALFAVGLFLAIGILGWSTGGLPNRFSSNALDLSAANLDTNPKRAMCDSRTPGQIASGEICTLGASGVSPTFAVFGDSFADAFSPGIEHAAKKYAASGLMLSRGGCYPLLGLTSSADDQCTEFLRAAINKTLSTPSIDTVILIARWTSAAEGTRFGGLEAGEWMLSDSATKAMDRDETRRVFERSLRRFVAAFPNKKVFVVAYIPEQEFDVPTSAALRYERGQFGQFGVPRALFDERQQFVRGVFNKLSDEKGAVIIDVGAKLCDRQRCNVFSPDGQLLYTDDNHLNAKGSIFLSDIFAPAIK